VTTEGGESPQTASAERFVMLSVLASGSNIVLGIVRSKLVAVQLGPTGIGIVAEASQLVTFLNVIISPFAGVALLSWLSQAAASKDFARVRRGLGTAVLCSMGLSVATGAAAIVGTPLFFSTGWPMSPRTAVAFVAGAQVFASIQACVMQAHVGFQDLRAMTWATISSNVLSTAVSVGLVLGFGLQGQFWAVFASAALGALTTVVLLARRNPEAVPRHLNFDGTFVRAALATGTVLLVSGYSAQALLTVARVALERGGAADGEAFNGHFQAASAIATTYFGLVLSGAANFYFPKFATAPTGQALSPMVHDAARLVLTYAPPLVFAAISVRDLVMHALYSADFKVAGTMLGYLLAGDISTAVGWAYGGPLPMRNRLRAFVLVQVINLLLGSLLILTLAPLVGPMGVAGALMVLPCVLLPIAALTTRASCGVEIQWRQIALAIGLSVAGAGLNAAIEVAPATRWVALVVVAVMAWKAGLVAKGVSFAATIARRMGMRSEAH
jgi:enterobacterial common antigen flippase